MVTHKILVLIFWVRVPVAQPLLKEVLLLILIYLKMERLKRYEIDAIMSKLKAQLQEKLKERKEKWMESFKESNPDYETLKLLADKIKVATNEMRELRSKLELSSSYLGLGDYLNTPDVYANDVYNRKNKKKSPDYTQIENDLIIASIGSNFDVQSFINDVLNEY